MAAKKEVVKKTKAIEAEFSSLPKSEIEKETKPKRGGRQKKVVEEEVGELILDGEPISDAIEGATPDTEDIPSEDEVIDEVVNEAVDEIADRITQRLSEIYGGDRKVKYANKKTMKALAKASKTQDGWREDGDEVKNDYDLLREETAELALAVDNNKKELKTIHIDECIPDEEIGFVVSGHLKSRGNKAKYQIKVALSELTAYTQSDFEGLKISTNEDMIRALKDVASRWVGSDIQVVITKVYESSRTAYASRLMASEMLARWNFRRHVGNSKKPSFGLGSKVKAQIVERKRDRLKVSIYGQETWIGVDEIVYGFAKPLYEYEEYEVGNWVNVLITDIIPDWVYEPGTGDNSYHLTKLEASIKQARENPLIENFHKYVVGGEYEAEPVFRTKSGRIMCVTWNGISILATPGAVGREGRRVMIRVTGKDDKTFKIWGNIIDPRRGK